MDNPLGFDALLCPGQISALLFPVGHLRRRGNENPLAIAPHPEYSGNEEDDVRSLERRPPELLLGSDIREGEARKEKYQNLIGIDEEAGGWDSIVEPFAPDLFRFLLFPQKNTQEGQREPSCPFQS